jgi:adenine-specific DNA-methyltransferase
MLNKQRIILGDCIDVMREVMPNECIDFVLTDPPYLVNYIDKTGRSIKNDNNSGDWVEPAFKEIYRVLKNNSFCVCFYGWNKIDIFMDAWKKSGFKVVGHLVFTKKYTSKTGVVNFQHENAYLLSKGRATPTEIIGDVIPWIYSGNTLHPTEKSSAMLTKIIKAFSKQGDIVLDPFCGSGSTCEAAVITGRKFVGIELDPVYFEKAKTRMEKFKP